MGEGGELGRKREQGEYPRLNRSLYFITLLQLIVNSNAYYA